VTHPSELRVQAEILRAGGNSIKSIAKKLDVSVGTMHGWISHIPISESQKDRLNGLSYGRRSKLHKTLLKKGEERRERWREEASKFWNTHNTNPLFMLGIGIYWGEGGKSEKGPRLSVANCDPALLRTWIAWCKAFIGKKASLRYRAAIYPDLKPSDVARYWEENIGAKNVACDVAKPSAQSKGICATKRPLKYGTMTVTLGKGSSEWFRKMIEFLKLTGKKSW